MSNRTLVNMPAPEIDDEPEVYFNPGREGGPFAVVGLGPELTLFIHEAQHARVIAAVFTQAADLLDTTAAAFEDDLTGNDSDGGGES
jgi:hypothetical protein